MLSSSNELITYIGQHPRILLWFNALMFVIELAPFLWNTQKYLEKTHAKRIQQKLFLIQAPGTHISILKSFKKEKQRSVPTENIRKPLIWNIWN